ncbi:MAG: N-acetylmuramoyl-L-alanine amidase, partial [Elusimicrobia bacterium]|nr:N-acetylmuramoyl-L-alanine amidase [Elusimicrobiota bacterium]
MVAMNIVRSAVLALLLASPVEPAAAAAAAAIPPSLAPIVLDPGHGGRDLGAIVGAEREKTIAFSIARLLKQDLSASGCAARLTRDGDLFVPLDRRVDDSLAWKGRAFVSLHLDEVDSSRPHGITVYSFGPSLFRSGPRRGPPPPPRPAPPP